MIIIKYMDCYFYFYINFYYCCHKNVEAVDICAFLIVKFRQSFMFIEISIIYSTGECWDYLNHISYSVFGLICYIVLL